MKLFVLIGKSAAGKDFLYQKLLERNPSWKPVIPYTTRPMRDGEEDGKVYHFVSTEEYDQMLYQKRVIECREYDTAYGIWRYFTASDDQIDASSDNIYLIISTLEGFISLRNWYNDACVVPLYIEVDDLTRVTRSLERQGCSTDPRILEIGRRLITDENDFSEEKLNRSGIHQRRRIQNYNADRALTQLESIIREEARNQKYQGD